VSPTRPTKCAISEETAVGKVAFAAVHDYFRPTPSELSGVCCRCAIVYRERYCHGDNAHALSFLLSQYIDEEVAGSFGLVI
jgi:hypothetical protein